MNIGDKLRNLRERSNLTQEEVGKRIGVTKATVNRYETGEIDIKRTVAIKLAEVLNSTPSYIMGWEDMPIDGCTNGIHPHISASLETDPDIAVLHMYKKLDAEDKAEIRGEIKQMLKAEKYLKTHSKQTGTKIPVAARDGNSEVVELTPEETETAKKKYPQYFD